MKYAWQQTILEDTGRSPSWGARIEIAIAGVMEAAGQRRSPSWGARIEIFYLLYIHISHSMSLPLVGSED